MKLRNKKNGKVVDAKSAAGGYDGGGQIILTTHGKDGEILDARHYDTLAEINDEWEDYVPKEPLVDDEKIRKVIRAWAEANDTKSVEVYDGGLNGDMCRLSFDYYRFHDFTAGGEYTIDELCGEEG